ncbi:uncharacterized protein LOC120041868 [Salvelinus namaycush]|uniref:Uncharacterized protein LOC120041868 n=1 Tax=Salvelinus namaycush TaxID=8040 RepID=A0A8U0QGN0_SALNM|nr:uncharacterized protein LOC120041868 [Salvelinus namaycush]
MSLSGEREEETTPSKMTQDTSSKNVQKPRAESPTTSLLSMKSDQPPTFSQEPLPDDNKEVESLDSEDALKITHNLLDRRSQTLLTVQQDIKAKLKHKYQHISEGIGHHGNQSLFKDIYTELYITEGGSGGLNNEHEVRQIEMASKKQTTQETPIKCNDIFKNPSATRLEPDQCSALAYLLLMSEEVLEEFRTCKTYNTSEEGYQRLLPVVRNLQESTTGWL